MARASRGSPKRSRPNKQAAERAVASLLEALGHPVAGELRGTPRRVASLWHDVLLAGEERDSATLLSGAAKSTSRAAVLVTDIGVHLVCPHHLTVAFGRAHLAYVPGGRLAGFGALARLVQAETARLVLQEDAVDAIAAALVTHLGAKVAVACIDAVHPCHNLLEPRSHAAHAVTWSAHGDLARAPALQARLEGAIARAAQQTRRKR